MAAVSNINSSQLGLPRLSRLVSMIARALTAQMGELFWETFLRFPVFPLDRILDGTGHRIVHTQHRALHQLDLSGRITAQTRCRCLPLLPGLRRSLRHGRLYTRPAIEPRRSGRILIGSIGENCYTRILQCIASQRIGGSVGVIVWRLEGARLVPVEEGLGALGVVVFFFVTVSVLVRANYVSDFLRILP